jgi:hypothetical protein
MKKIIPLIIFAISMAIFSGCMGITEYKDFNIIESVFVVVIDLEFNITF